MKSVNKAYKDHLTMQERIAVKITESVGTMICVYIFCIIGIGSLIGVITNNTYLALLCGAVSSYFLQLVLLPLLMLGQNLQQRHQEMLAEEDFQTNVKAELEVEELKKGMERLTKSMNVVVDHITAKKNADIEAMQQELRGLQEENIKIQKENLLLLANNKQKIVEKPIKTEEDGKWLNEYE